MPGRGVLHHAFHLMTVRQDLRMSGVQAEQAQQFGVSFPAVRHHEILAGASADAEQGAFGQVVDRSIFTTGRPFQRLDQLFVKTQVKLAERHRVFHVWSPHRKFLSVNFFT